MILLQAARLLAMSPALFVSWTVLPLSWCYIEEARSSYVDALTVNTATVAPQQQFSYLRNEYIFQESDKVLAYRQGNTLFLIVLSNRDKSYVDHERSCGSFKEWMHNYHHSQILTELKVCSSTSGPESL